MQMQEIIRKIYLRYIYLIYEFKDNFACVTSHSIISINILSHALPISCSILFTCTNYR
jgi:hypothetical protein